MKYIDHMTVADAAGVDATVVGIAACVAAVSTASGALRLAATG